jgi:hypothetical protein
MKTIDDYLERANIQDDLTPKEYAVINLNDNDFGMRVKGEPYVIYFRGVEIGRSFVEDTAWLKALAHYVNEIYGKDEMSVSARYGFKPK